MKALLLLGNLFFCCLLVACKPETAQDKIPASPSTEAQIINADLQNALREVEKNLNSPRTRLEFSNGTQAHNCNQYLTQLSQHVALSENIHNQAVKSEYLICDALKLLQGKPFAFAPSGINIGKQLATQFDIRRIPTSLAPRADEQHYTLQTLFPGQVKIKNTSVEIDNADMHFKLELVAIADINSNGTADWIMWLSDEVKDGNYKHYATVLVFDPQPGQMLNGRFIKVDNTAGSTIRAIQLQ